jgi:hypothetical protein
MSQKKDKLIKKYLNKRNAKDKIYLTKSGITGKLVRHSVMNETKDSYKTANSNDKRLLTNFFKSIIV